MEEVRVGAHSEWWERGKEGRERGREREKEETEHVIRLP